MNDNARVQRCILALEDGTFFLGRPFGAKGTRTGEVVFNTSMMGYQEILTDPSYCGQIVAMTYPHVGNYGVNADDVESVRPQVAGFVARELSRLASNHRAARTLDEYLGENGIIGIQEVDTRALTRKLRADGAMRGVLSTEIDDPPECVRLARESPGMEGADLVQGVAPKDASQWTTGLDHCFYPSRIPVPSPPPTPGGRNRSSPIGNRQSPISNPQVVAIDCGMKRNILRHLISAGCSVTVAPPTWSAARILERKPDGLFVSNGPGDPAAVSYGIEMLRGLVGKIPVFGICLGHQLLGLALGAETFKLKFGHRGANHPVKNLATGRVEITSQNHGFVVDPQSLKSAGGVATHVSLNDQTLEGFVHRDWPLMAVQYHPEASPGPHDATYLFDLFVAMMATRRPPTPEQMSAAQNQR